MTDKKKKTEIPGNDPAKTQARNTKEGQLPDNSTREEILNQQYQRQNPNQGSGYKSK